MTSLVLYRIATAHVLYVVLAGAGIWLWLRRSGVDVALAEAAICSLPALLGLVLAFTSAEDQEQYIMRLAAAAMFTTVLLLFWANSAGLSGGHTAIAAALHALCFVGAVLWLGTRTTRVAPAANVTPVDATTLQARLLSLNATGAPLHVSSPTANELIVVFQYPVPDRSYRILLNLDSSAQQVRVRERASSNLATPLTPREKSMRAPGQPALDPTRPQAQKVSELVAQVTIIRPGDLAATQVAWQGTDVAVPAGFAAALDERGVVTLVCAVVTRSGWQWQPAFFGAQ